MTLSPWQRALLAIRQALELGDETALAAAREGALALAVPRELTNVLEAADAEALAGLLPVWAADEFGSARLPVRSRLSPGSVRSAASSCGRAGSGGSAICCSICRRAMTTVARSR
jgi:hypothetical protein